MYRQKIVTLLLVAPISLFNFVLRKLGVEYEMYEIVYFIKSYIFVSMIVLIDHVIMNFELQKVTLLLDFVILKIFRNWLTSDATKLHTVPEYSTYVLVKLLRVATAKCNITIAKIFNVIIVWWIIFTWIAVRKQPGKTWNRQF